MKVVSPANKLDLLNLAYRGRLDSFLTASLWKMFKLEGSSPCANKLVFLVWSMNEDAERLGHKGHMWNIHC